MNRKRSLSSHLSRRIPDPPEVMAAITEIASQTDRGAAIIAAAYVELALTTAMKCRLVNKPEEYKNWFVQEGAPFKTFNQRIIGGRALGLYAEDFEKDLHVIRDIRNQFAHTIPSLDFTNEHILKECRGLNTDFSQVIDQGRELSEGRRQYEGACLMLAQILFGAGSASTMLTVVRLEDIQAAFARLDGQN